MKPAEINAKCLLCQNVWRRDIQTVCDCCGCGSFQVAERAQEAADAAREAANEDRLLGGAA